MGFFMYRILSDYFYFNQRERRGIIGLYLIIGLIIILNFFMDNLIKEDKNVYRNFYTQVALIDSISKQQDSLLKLSLINKTPKYQRKSKKRFKLNIELNSADTTELMKVRGIGPAFSKRIIKYRNLLGGYHSVSQLKEVYGLDKEKFEQIHANFIACDSNLIRHLNINQASFKELLKHPYISFDFTKFIVNRRGKKAFTKLSQLKDDYLISDSSFQKLLPYLKLK